MLLLFVLRQTLRAQSQRKIQEKNSGFLSRIFVLITEALILIRKLKMFTVSYKTKLQKKHFSNPFLCQRMNNRYWSKLSNFSEKISFFQQILFVASISNKNVGLENRIFDVGNMYFAHMFQSILRSDLSSGPLFKAYM